MFKVSWLPGADAELMEILRETDFDVRVLNALDNAQWLMKAKPLSLGRERTSSVHRMFSCDPLLIEIEVIVDDQRVLVHSCSLLP